MSKISEQRRQEILNAAAEEFRSKGIDGASISDIAARAGIGKSTVYEYFPSKTELFTDMCNQKMQTIRDQICTVFDQEIPFRDRMVSYCTVMLSNLEGVDMGSLLLMFANNPIAADLSGNTKQLLDFAGEKIEQAIRQAQVKGELSSSLNIRAATCWLLSLPNPHLFWYLQDQKVEHPVEQIVDYTITGLAGF